MRLRSDHRPRDRDRRRSRSRPNAALTELSCASLPPISPPSFLLCSPPDLAQIRPFLVDENLPGRSRRFTATTWRSDSIGRRINFDGGRAGRDQRRGSRPFGRELLLPGPGHDRGALDVASAQRLPLVWPGLVAVVGATAYAQVRLNAWNGPFYDSLGAQERPEFLQQLIVFAELAGLLLALNVAQMWLNQKSKLVLRRRARRGPARRMAVAAARLSPVTRRRDRRQSGSANPGGRQAPHGTDDRPRDRPAAIDAAAAQLHRGALGAVRQDGPGDGGVSLRSEGLHGLVRAALCGSRLAAELARRAAADPAQRRTLRARGRFSHSRSCAPTKKSKGSRSTAARQTRQAH